MRSKYKLLVTIGGLFLVGCVSIPQPDTANTTFENACKIAVSGKFNRSYGNLTDADTVEISLDFSHDSLSDTNPDDPSRGIFVIDSGNSSFTLGVNGSPQITATIDRIEVNNQLTADVISLRLANVAGTVGQIDQSTAPSPLAIDLARVHPDTSRDWAPLTNDYIPIDEPLWTALDTKRSMTLAEQFPGEPNLGVITLSVPSVKCKTIRL